MIFQMYENLVSQIHDLIHTVRVLIFLNPEGNRNGAPSVRTSYFRAPPVDASMFGKGAVVSLIDELFELRIQRRLQRHARKNVLELQHALLSVDGEAERAAAQPLKSERVLTAAGLRFAEAAKDPSIRVCL